MFFCRDVLTVIMLTEVAEYHYVAFLSVVMLSVTVQNFIMLMLSIIILNVVLPSVLC